MTRGSGCFVLCACLTWLLGCGARTSTLEDELGGQNQGGASGTPTGGMNQGGTGGGQAGTNPGHGGSTPIAGAGGAGGSFGGAPVGGAGGSFGGAPVGGAGGSFAGAPFGGFAGSFGGSSGFGGFAGFGAIGGTAGVAGAAGGIGELCSVLGGSSCAQCQCKSCAPAIEGCFSDLGCAFIFACAQQTGCQGISCYSPSTCQPVIDQFGGLGGGSMKKVFSLLTCAVSTQATCGCN